MIELDLLQYQSQLQLKVLDGKRMVFDPIRKKWLILSPEELVRQLLVIFLINEKGYNKNRIALEKALKVNGMLRRWDILIYNESKSGLWEETWPLAWEPGALHFDCRRMLLERQKSGPAAPVLTFGSLC